ncbi:hypothetical protein DT87_00385 [Streptomyces sp. NTK 937]|nr:hypothetical protein DT87_00385 [Streptomyces sp. NTK 937]
MARTATRGYATPALTVGARELYADDIVALDTVIPDALPRLPVPEAPAKHRTPARLTLQCQCKPVRKMQMSPTVVDRGPVLCGVCGQPFTPS